MKRLNIIGAGAVGKVLGARFHLEAILHIQHICNRSRLSAQAARDFIGAGEVCNALKQMAPADIWMLSVGDDGIEAVAAALAEENLMRKGDIVFHCGGARPSTLLAPLQAQGASIASVHPVFCFATPEEDVAKFPGCYCALEGDEAALHVLEEAFTAIGAKACHVPTGQKLLYHTGLVTVSNLLVALLEVGYRQLEASGLSRADAGRLAAPLIRYATEQVLTRGPEKALTGPVSRGDVDLTQAELHNLQQNHPEVQGEIYRLLSKVALELARERGRVEKRVLDAMERVLVKSQEQKIEKNVSNC